MNRRDFLKNAALLAGGALVAPTIIRSELLGKNAPSNRINVGMIGIGRQAAQPNIPQIIASSHGQIVAVCDVDKWRLDNAVKQVNDGYAAQKGFSYKGVQAFDDYREVLNQRDVDAVMISSPDHWHVPMAYDAVRAGKHVSLEKPISTCIGHTKRLVSLLKQHPEIVTRNDSEFRTMPGFIRAVELAKNGAVGKIRKIYVGVPKELSGAAPGDQPTMPVPAGLNYDMWCGPVWEAPYTENRVHPQQAYTRPGWMRVSDTCNGMITNWGAHLMGIAQWGNGTEYTGPVAIEGSGDFDKGLWNTLNCFDVNYTYADGVELHFTIERPFVRFEGTDGWVEIEYKEKLTASNDAILGYKFKPGDIRFEHVLNDKEDWLVAIKEKKQTMEPLETAHRTISMCQMGLIAITVGSKLRWDPVAEDFVGNNAASALIDRPIREKYFKF